MLASFLPFRRLSRTSYLLNPFPANAIRSFRRGAQSPAGEGVGGVPIPTTGETRPSTLSTLCMNPLPPVLQVNVGQELLPSLLHTARCFKIKGLDNVQTPPGLLDLNVRT